jgi:hypothetical protein
MSPGAQLAFAMAAVTAKKIRNVSRVEELMGD